jgi:hypothetical protein
MSGSGFTRAICEITTIGIYEIVNRKIVAIQADHMKNPNI